MTVRNEVPYEAIGRMSVAFGTLEMTVVHLGINMTHASNVRGRPCPTRRSTLAQVLDRISDLVKDNPYCPEYRERCGRLLTETRAVNRRRRDAIHAYPTLNAQLQVQLVYPGDLDRGCTKPIGVAELRRIENDCRALHSEAFQLADLAHQSLVATHGQ